MTPSKTMCRDYVDCSGITSAIPKRWKPENPSRIDEMEECLKYDMQQKSTSPRAMLYISECCAVKSQQESKFSVAEIRMLFWMSTGEKQYQKYNYQKEKWDNIHNREDIRISSYAVWAWIEKTYRLIGRVDQMENRPIVKGKRRPRKPICQSLRVI